MQPNENSRERVRLTSDYSPNAGSPRIQLTLFLFRAANRLRQPTARQPRWYSVPIGILYRFIAEWWFGIEIPWKTSVGPRLTVFHGYGLVVNDRAVIGSDVILRHGVTIGSLESGGPCPIIEDGVEIGATATILGGVRIGKNAKIGAGAVVLSDIPPGSTAVGVPARVIVKDASSWH